MKTSWRIETAAALLLLMTVATGCGGGGGTPAGVDPTPTPSGLTAGRASTLVNDGLVQKLSAATGATVILDGAVSVDGATVTFDHLSVTKAPYSLSGGVSVIDGADGAQANFAGGVAGSLSIDGVPSGSVTAAFPMTSDFAQANAHWAIHTAMAGAGHSTFANGITVTDNGNGTFTIDGTETCGPVTITIDMLTIDPVNMTINGKITIDDGNGNTAELDFNGTTVDILVNGQLVATVDLSQIFGP